MEQLPAVIDWRENQVSCPLPSPTGASHRVPVINHLTAICHVLGVREVEFITENVGSAGVRREKVVEK
ncbi:MAG: hypothetical protein ABJO09_18160 [Hyphomicrobiales bacterium]